MLKNHKVNIIKIETAGGKHISTFKIIFEDSELEVLGEFLTDIGYSIDYYIEQYQYFLNETNKEFLIENKFGGYWSYENSSRRYFTLFALESGIFVVVAEDNEKIILENEYKSNSKTLTYDYIEFGLILLEWKEILTKNEVNNA